MVKSGSVWRTACRRKDDAAGDVGRSSHVYHFLASTFCVECTLNPSTQLHTTSQLVWMLEDSWVISNYCVWPRIFWMSLVGGWLITLTYCGETAVSIVLPLSTNRYWHRLMQHCVRKTQKTPWSGELQAATTCWRYCFSSECVYTTALKLACNGAATWRVNFSHIS